MAMPAIDVMVKEIKEQVTTDLKEVKEKVDPLKSDIEQLKKAVDTLETKSKTSKIEVKDRHFPGQKMAQLWKCQLIADKEKKNIEEVASDIYERDEQFVTEVKALTAGGNAGLLINEAYYAEVLPLLYNRLAVKQLGARTVPMPNGNLTIRRLASGSTASYIGESQKINASKPTFSRMKLSSKKLSVKVPFSKDLLRSASPEADRMVLEDMTMQTALKMDYTAMYGAGTEYTPLGVTKTPSVTDASASELLTGDGLYTKLVVPLKQNNILMNSPGWIFNPSVFAVLYNETFTNGTWKYRDELKNGRFHGFPFVETNQISTGTDSKKLTDIFFGDWSEFFIGEQIGLEVTTSEDAYYYNESGTQVSAFDMDEIVTKAILIHDMGIARPKAFAWARLQTIA